MWQQLEYGNSPPQIIEISTKKSKTPPTLPSFLPNFPSPSNSQQLDGPSATAKKGECRLQSPEG